ncbi:MAG: hypothetical protein KF764_19555 [Labilithrix sp.]|nr:hypothetical protein [Labilithrix sp.]MBX3222674.1 hypothetical protein [Labilithrix sp.]
MRIDSWVAARRDPRERAMGSVKRPPGDEPPDDEPPASEPPTSDAPASEPPPSEPPASEAPLPPLPLKPTPVARTAERARNRRRTALIVLAPIVAVATMMLGLRVGAGNVVHAASVFAAPPGKPASPDAPVPFAWQVLTYLEDRGTRETLGVSDLTVIARSKGHESRWSGASNADGVAEPSLALPGLAPNDPVEIEVRAAGDAEPLARGFVDWQSPAWAREPTDDGARAAVRPSKREGAIALDVLVEGERLVVGEATPLWAHVGAPGGDASRVTLTLTPEAGLRLDEDTAKIGCDGWAEIAAVADGHVAGIQIDAKDPDGRHGTWFGALPVAPGAFFVGAPRFVRAGTKETAVLVAPNPRTVVYAEVDDERGRVFAAALPLAVEPGDPVPRARFAMPALAPGLHWIVVSGEPRGAERLAGAAIAKPFLVGDAPGVRPDEACSIGPWLAKRPATGFPRWLALDGMATRGAANRASHRLGLFIGLLALFAAAVLEVLLLTAAAREARAIMLLADLDEPAAARERVTAKPPGGGLAIALLVAVLGFALLAVLMLTKG